MVLYTSYFAMLSKLRKSNIVPISIAQYNPKWFDGMRLAYLAPKPFMLAKSVTEEEYIRLYKEVILSNLDPYCVLRDIGAIGAGKDVALLCYEKPGEFCHRRLLAEWLAQRTNVLILEFTPPEEAKPQSPQLSLFD